MKNTEICWKAVSNRAKKLKVLAGHVLSRKAGASFTIEAAVVVPLCMVVLASVVLAAFNLHDNVVLKASAPSLVLESAAEFAKEGKTVYDYEAYFKRRLIVLKNAAVESSEKDDGIVFTGSADFNTDLKMAGLLLGGSTGSRNVRIEIACLKPRKNLVKYKILCEAAEKAGLSGGQENN